MEQNRVLKGMGGAGQFAAMSRAEPGISLAPRLGGLPAGTVWTDKRIWAAAEARQAAAEALERDMAASDAALEEKKRTADQEFFDWDTDFAAGSLGARLGRRYLKDRAVLREMFNDLEFRYNREYTHKTLAPLRESAQVFLNRALNRIEERTGSDGEWFIRL